MSEKINAEMKTELCSCYASFKSRSHFYKAKAFQRVNTVLWYLVRGGQNREELVFGM